MPVPHCSCNRSRQRPIPSAAPLLAADALAPEIALPESFRYAPATAKSEVPELRYWWRKFGDAELDSLIDRALRNNLDLKIAASRVAQARSTQKAPLSWGSNSLTLSSCLKILS